MSTQWGVRPQARRSAGKTIVPMPRSNDSWAAALDRFLADCRRRNLSASTLENYRWWLAGPRLAAYRAEHGIVTLADMTAAHLTAFEGELVDAGLRPSSVDSFHRHAKNFIGYCLREGTAADETALKVSGPRLSQEEPETFTAEEQRALLAALKDRPRDAILIEFMLKTGLRLAEVCNVTVDDIVDTPQGAFVRVRQGKGRKDRAVPLDTGKDKFSRRLLRYVDRVRPVGTPRRELFLSLRQDRPGDYQPLTTQGIQVLCRRLSASTGIHVNPHKFRHTFATQALAAGVDVMALQRALGHTTLAMVSRYVHYSHTDLLNAWQIRRD